MQAKNSGSLDTKAMIPVYCSIFMLAAELFLPWFSMPVLKYSKLPTSYTLWNVQSCLDNIQSAVLNNERFSMPPLTGAEIECISSWIHTARILGIISIVLVAVEIGLILYLKKRSAIYVRLISLVSVILPVAAFYGVYQANLMINEKMERASDFVSLTLQSYVQLTAFPYAQFILGVLVALLAGKLLDINFEYKTSMYIERKVVEDKKLGTRLKVSILLILVAIPAIIFFGIYFLNDRSAQFIGLCIIGLSMIPFCMVFEERRPQAREVLLIAVMAAIAVVGRMAFFMVPQFKPVTAIVIITGVSLGAEAGFLTGAVAGFVSNFFFGQGPWTPWQMFAFGIIGFLAGLIFRGNRKKYKNNKIILCVYGGIATLIIYGLLMDTSSVTMFSGDFNWESLRAMYISGFPFNVVHGISTVTFLFFLARPMMKKLDRIKKKYGIMVM